MPDLPLPARFVGGELLGRGAGTEVYRAHDRLLDRPVAVKMFAPDADQERIDREGQALARLTHPGLVTIYDSGRYESRPYLVMQLIVGDTLSARLIEGPLPVPTVLDLAVRLTDALAHVHGRGIVHRDIKPSNIFLNESGQPFLGDFGIALVRGQARLTSYDEIIGTPAYLAPEQVRGVAVGPAADIYALGLVLIECLTGEVEYAAESKAEVALARLSRAPRIPVAIPVGLRELLRTMTDDQPGRRPTARACAAQLSALTTGATQPLSRPLSMPLSMPLSVPRASRRGGLLIAAGVCVVAAAVAGVLALTHPAAPTRPAGTGALTSPAPVVPSTSAEPLVSSAAAQPSASVAEQPIANTTQVTHDTPNPGQPAAPPKAGPNVPPGHGSKPGKHKPKS